MGLILSLVLGFILGLILDLILVWILGLNLGLILGLISGLILGVILGLILGWIPGLILGLILSGINLQLYLLVTSISAADAANQFTTLEFIEKTQRYIVVEKDILYYYNVFSKVITELERFSLMH